VGFNLEEGDKVSLTLPLTDGPSEIRAELLRVDPLRRDLDTIGLRFLDVDAHGADRLRRYVFAKQLDQRRKGV
jgi:c-di-GMP-binding flagellar brake protein YcgR